MASSTIRKAFDAMKDQASIGIAIISNSTRISALEVAIVKATRHEECPADEKHIVYILTLTCYSKTCIKYCVKTIAKRLDKTSNWIVALKSLMLVHRLLLDGDAAYEQEIFYATRRGTRMLNMADFQNTSRSVSWDFSAFVRAYALYLDERLDFRMQMRRRLRGGSVRVVEDGQWDGSFRHANSTPVRDMKTERIFLRAQHLLNLLERCLACRPTQEQPGDRMALALFDGESATEPTASTVSAWEAFGTQYDSTDWETTLVQSASHLSNQKVTLGSGFDMSLLDNMYKQPNISTMLMHQNGVTGSASSMALGSSGWPTMLALPGPPMPGSNIAGDPFQASLPMPPPSYVQMSEMEKKQKLLVEEQLMWQQYANNGRQGHLGFVHQQPHTYSMGTYTYGY